MKRKVCLHISGEILTIQNSMFTIKISFDLAALTKKNALHLMVIPSFKICTTKSKDTYNFSKEPANAE